jgi:hypothetical protein
VCPAIVNNDLHFIDDAVFSHFFVFFAFSSPLVNASPHCPFFQPGRGHPSTKAVLPQGSEYLPRGEHTAMPMNLVVRVATVAHAHLRIDICSFPLRDKRIVGVDEATFGSFEVRSRERVGYAAET